MLGLPESRVVAVSSATAGLVAALRALGVGKGDEVITAAFGWGQTLNAIFEVGARAVFADVEQDGMNLDLAEVERAVSKRTRAVLAAELCGIPLDWRRLADLRERFGAPTVVDAAQCFGAVHAGPFPPAVVYSFGRGKTVCGGEGGAVATSDERVYDALLGISQHPIQAMQDVLSDIPLETIDTVAPNARMHPFAAALVADGIVRFDKSLGEWHRLVDEARSILRENGFAPVRLPDGATQALPAIPVLTDEGERLTTFCNDHGWTVARSPNRVLTRTTTVRRGYYLPALHALGIQTGKAQWRAGSCGFDRAESLAGRIYLVCPKWRFETSLR